MSNFVHNSRGQILGSNFVHNSRGQILGVKFWCQILGVKFWRLNFGAQFWGSNSMGVKFCTEFLTLLKKRRLKYICQKEQKKVGHRVKRACCAQYFFRIIHYTNYRLPIYRYKRYFGLPE